MFTSQCLTTTRKQDSSTVGRLVEHVEASRRKSMQQKQSRNISSSNSSSSSSSNQPTSNSSNTSPPRQKATRPGALANRNYYHTTSTTTTTTTVTVTTTTTGITSTTITSTTTRLLGLDSVSQALLQAPSSLLDYQQPLQLFLAIPNLPLTFSTYVELSFLQRVSTQWHTQHLRDTLLLYTLF
ncbi:hypothetical protein M0804_005300 [Polistes exclamans]|nr:hypothetical protein M0804_005300 [Polistes exclamans]